jgi:quinolinate synthase
VLIKAIRRIKTEKNILLLAHYYQLPEIQDLADYVGDSLGLSQYAASISAETIAFAGVQFMAETAKILNPQAKVLIPDMEAGCSLADSCPPAEFKKFLQSYPDHTVITDINCSAAQSRGIVFAPDKNLGKYLNWKTKRELVLWDGACVVHEAFAIDKLLSLSAKFPDAKIVAHPESEK